MHLGFAGLIGVSPPMQRVYELIDKVSQHSNPVLILGESGTGKELAARSIHFRGPRRQKGFVPVDCSSLVPTLIESELFGYVKGAFTGALNSKQGLLESADQGTLFLDEIGELPIDLQAKLLRVIQEKKVKPVGSTDWMSLDIRVIAATHRDLESALQSGAFRQDLFFRLNVVQIKLPALRERRSDIPLLVSYFLQKFSDLERPSHVISDEALWYLMAHSWPGNVRELENVIERGIVLASGPTIGVKDLPQELQCLGESALRPEAAGSQTLAGIVRNAVLGALEKTHGDKIAAARLLGIGKTTLYRKLARYGVESPIASGASSSSQDFKAASPAESHNRPRS